MLAPTLQLAEPLNDFRRTGITLKEGQRDEYGMEEVEGIFSSPEKSPAKVNGFGDGENEDSIGSEGMSMDDGMLTCQSSSRCSTI